jgi:hypothetical protein
MIFVTDAHHGNGKRFVVHADEKLTAFLELERITRLSGVSTLTLSQGSPPHVRILVLGEILGSSDCAGLNGAERRPLRGRADS